MWSYYVLILWNMLLTIVIIMQLCKIKVKNESLYLVKNKPECKHKYFKRYTWSEYAKNN